MVRTAFSNSYIPWKIYNNIYNMVTYAITYVNIIEIWINLLVLEHGERDSRTMDIHAEFVNTFQLCWEVLKIEV